LRRWFGVWRDATPARSAESPAALEK
jgi:hypothetical protein